VRTTDPPILITQYYNTPRATVWKALTTPAAMQQWYFKEIEEFEPTEGFATQFTFGTADKQFTTNWKVTQVIPNELIRYSWNYEHYPGNSEVCFKLAEENNKTLLQFEVTILEDFPEDQPEFTWESAFAGWRYVLKEALKKYLND